MLFHFPSGDGGRDRGHSRDGDKDGGVLAVGWVTQFVLFAHKLCLALAIMEDKERVKAFAARIKHELIIIETFLRRDYQTEEEGELAFSHMCQRCRVFNGYSCSYGFHDLLKP